MWFFALTSGVLACICASVISLLVFNKGRGIPYQIKYWTSLYHLKIYKRKTEKKLSVYKNLSKPDASPTDIGILPSDVEYELENPSDTKLNQQSDGIHFMGVDSGENMIDVCVNQIGDGSATVWLLLKLPNDVWYQLPHGRDTRRAYIGSPNLFSSSGLQIRCLIPLRRWRISFNGLLRKFDKGNTKTAENEELVHVKFSFVWLSMSIVQELNIDFNSKEVAQAFANALRSATSDDINCFSSLRNRYEQWGQLMGTVNVAGSAEKELYLWSMRTRLRDKQTMMDRKNSSFIKLFMYFKEGVPLKIECTSIKDFLVNYADGYTITGGGQFNNASDIDLKTQQLCHLKNSFPEEVTFYLGGKREKITIEFLKEDIHLYIGNNLESSLIIKALKVKMDNMIGFGLMHYGFRSEAKPTEYFLPPPMILNEKSMGTRKTCLVLPLSSDECESSQVSGGKGCSLSLLTKLSKKTSQFTVPKGLVITTAAFEHHIKTNSNVNLAIHQLQNVSCEKVQGNIKEECLKCVDEFNSSKLCDVLASKIQSELTSEFKDFQTVRFSVRSSACGEDSEDLSAAGQMLTILGVSSLKKIIDAIIQCWSSKFTFEAVQYSRQNGQSIQSSMAVVIQEMVPSEISGVMFTVDPVTGDPSHPYITANYGLGETVVSSLAEPDTFILKRSACNDVSVFERRVGSKETQVFLKEREGVEKKQFQEKSVVSCLTDEWAVKIGQVGLMIEDCFCGPRDIEFAVSDDQLYLLQARPITTLHTETEFELIHDQDNPVRSDHEYWTRANTGEVFSGATSPLGISLVAGVMDLYAQRSQILRERKHDVVFCPYYLHMLPVTHKQVTISLIDTIYRMNEKEISKGQSAIEVAFFGRVIADKKIHDAGVKKYGYASRFQKFARLAILTYVTFKAPRILKLIEEKIKNYKLPMETFTTASKTWDGIMSQMTLYGEVCAVHGLATFLSSFFNEMVLTRLTRDKKEWDNESYCDFANLLSSCTDVESAEVPTSLQNLARAIAQTDGQTFASLDPDAAYSLLQNDDGLPGNLFKTFLQRHGHRCWKEFDLRSVSWGMKPEILIPTLQSMVKSTGIQDSKPKVDSSVESTIAKLQTPVTYFTRCLLRIVLPWSRAAVGQREKSKSMMIKTVDWFRQSCHHLGQMMVQEGMLPNKDLVFYLTLEEIHEMLKTQRPGLVPKAIRRQRLQSKLEVLQFPEIIFGIPKPIKDDFIPEDFSSSLVLIGTPVCQGTVKGPVRVIVALEEASLIQNGDILITHSTDIGWSPYFPLLSGVVTVLGGLISHGAVVAREYGLPCIVGVKGATTAFKSGDIVVLDGTKGTITKLEKK